MSAKGKGRKPKDPLAGGKHTARSNLNPVYPSHTNRAKVHTRNRKRRSMDKLPTIRCKVCGKSYRRITPTHLKKHNLTVEQYIRTFGSGVSPAPMPHRPAPGLGTGVRHGACEGPLPVMPKASEAGLAVARELLSDEHFVRRLADEAASVIFTSSLRDQFRLALCSVLSARLELHGRAVASLQSIRDELDQPWRVEAGGGPHGAPTPTKDLLGMAAQAHAEVTKTEDALLKAIKMAADEAKDNRAAFSGLGGKPAFTGDAEVIPVPPSLSPGERETVRSLLGLLREGMVSRVEQRDERLLPVEGEAGDVDDGAVSPSNDSGAAPDPGPPFPADPFPLG